MTAPLPLRWQEARRPRPASTISEIIAVFARYELDPRRPMSDDQITDLAVSFRLAFVQMLNGYANEENWGCCVCSLNIALVLAEWGYGEDYIPHFNGALEGAFRAKLRAGRTGKWGFDGPAIQSIKEAFAIHEEQLKVAPKQQIRDALQEVHQRMNEGNVFMEEA